MAKRKGLITMHHPDAGLEHTFTDEKQAKAFERSGWRRGPLPAKAKKGES